MENFTYYNPVRIVFGKGTIPRISGLVPETERVLITYGGGSIKRNGVYDQVAAALHGSTVFEFGGIEPNPRYETLMRAVEFARAEDVTFLLAVGGGSVLDGTKFIAAAIPCTARDPWDFVSGACAVENALPLGTVLTLPATGSEMNPTAVITRESTREKLPFASDKMYPLFSILDPETTYTLPPHQTVNGIIDTFVHVTEQYLTFPADTPLQDRQAEAILATVIEEGPKALKRPHDYAVRATLMWCATQALNGLIGVGVPQDWATHMIGHEITALYGLDHAVTLAIVLPALLRYERDRKGEKILQYGARIWGITTGVEVARIDETIEQTESFFRSFGVKTRLNEYGIAQEGLPEIGSRLDERGVRLGEHGDITGAQVTEILGLAW